MISLRRNLFLLLAASGALAVHVSGQSGAPEAREEILEKAERLRPLAVTEVEGKFADAPNPFFAEQPEVPGAADGERAAPVARAAPNQVERQILRELSGLVRPSGVMQMGNRTMLLFGERRVGPGDVLPVQYQGQNYQVEIIAVDSRAFTMRLNQEVISKRIQ